MHHRPTGPRFPLFRRWQQAASRRLPTTLALATAAVLLGSGTALAFPALTTSSTGAAPLTLVDSASSRSASPSTVAGGSAAGHRGPGAVAGDGDGREPTAHGGAGTAPVAGTTAAASATSPAANGAKGAPSATAAGDSAAGANAAGNRRHFGDTPDARGEAQPKNPAANPNCTLRVPADPTSAAGLATPYQLSATDRRAGPCHETSVDQAAFVEAAILDPATGAVSIYHPVVVDAGAAPAVAPVPVTVPSGAVVGVWFGYNGDVLTLSGPGARSCVNGLPGSPFGQFAYCNAPAFFTAANDAIAAGKLTVPPLGTGRDGLPCPTSRDFVVVDQDQSDNLATVYRVVKGRIAQDTAAARRGKALSNGSDEALLARSIDPALGCTPFQAPDLTNGGALTSALALNELSAAAHQAAPMALTPISDPMTQVDGRTSTRKTNLYRAGVGQPPLPAGQDPQAYCANVRDIASARLERDAALLQRAPSPAVDSANLFQFLRTRLKGTLVMLKCDRG
jgi:hypothetical protein